MLVNSIVEHGNIVGIGKAAVLGAPSRTRPGEPVLKHGLKNHSCYLAVSHEAFFMLVKIRFLVHLKVMQIGIVELVFFQQRSTPALRPMAEHLLVERSCPPLDHAAFVDQASAE